MPPPTDLDLSALQARYDGPIPSRALCAARRRVGPFVCVLRHDDVVAAMAFWRDEAGAVRAARRHRRSTHLALGARDDTAFRENLRSARSAWRSVQRFIAR